MMKRCVICGVELDEINRSQEHIIPNAIGGSFKDDGIYCKKCNECYGSSQDKAFTQIFAPIVDGIKMHKDRKSRGISYTGIMYDQEGNLYTALYKDGRKVIKLEDDDSKYVKYEDGKFNTLLFNFKLDNDAFKMGISKIAFNYAIHCGFDACSLEGVFDFSSKKLINKPIVIPFVPMTLFDIIMEMHPVAKIFHAVRIFNLENYLYAYIELFNTFQYYVLLSETYDYTKSNNIDISYGNIIEMNEPLDEDLKKDLYPVDYRDADIICTQYQIDTKELIKDLKNYSNYDSLDTSEQWKKLSEKIRDTAYEIIRKESYLKEYMDLINQHYNCINFSEELNTFKGNEASKFFEDFQFYTIYNDDCVNMEKYKKILPDGSVYPHAILEDTNNNQHIGRYCHIKFKMLSDRLN